MINPSLINIVCLGHWNTKIFTAQWVANNIFKTKIENVGGLVNQNDIEMAYSYMDMGVTLFPKPSALEIRVDKCGEENNSNFPEIINMFNRIIDCLPHTPIKAVGININYKLEDSLLNPLLLKIKSEINNLNFSDFQGGSFMLTKIIDEFNLNLTVSSLFDNNSKITDLNFNFQTSKQLSLKENIFDIFFNITKDYIKYE